MPAASTDLVAADPVAVARDMRSILATNEADFQRLKFINPEDPRLEHMQATVERQRGEYEALLGSLDGKEREQVNASPLAQVGPAQAAIHQPHG